ncbi:fatty acyl-AMP ligase [Amycolatopsis anabasis]|uniref:fatty acyl-AMP ligase n=1 Tax=Amycolatopsis anabasis TaxID=1840409 RepID=UPI00131CE9FC|nr:fatty acyl-AMP ligase [Amycolatopsis anabasis]
MLASSEGTSAHRAEAEGARNLSGLLTEWARIRGDQIAVTHLDYRFNPEGVANTLTWRELDARVTAVAAWLSRTTQPGERAAILARQNVDYIVAFLAALRAGLVAVPLFVPGAFGRAEGIASLIADAVPSVVLTTRDVLMHVRTFLSGRQPRVRQVVAVDAVPNEAGTGFVPPPCGPEDLAYLQYTSGSTRSPAGVMVTHANVLANARQAAYAYGAAPDRSVAVSWLPLFHDMGLVLAIAAPVTIGIPVVLMDPLAFLEQPVRWLRALSAHPGAISAAPSFAYGLCAARVGNREKALLKLDQVTALINGGEPVRPTTVHRFQRAFADCGLKPQSHRSSYGLAEATVFVSASPSGVAPRKATFYRAQLALGEAVPAPPGEASTTTLVSCGFPVGQHVRVVDPETRRELESGRVGEIWVSGPNVGRGYWRRPGLSADTFCALIENADEESEPRWWLRTGDLGVLADSELYVTGRIKDLVIVDGRNHYPQDVEATVERAHSAIKPHVVACFAVPAEDGEKAVVVAELAGWAGTAAADRTEAELAVRQAVSAEHGLALLDVLLLPPGGVPRTTSGKVARAECRERYAAGAFLPGVPG